MPRAAPHDEHRGRRRSRVRRRPSTTVTALVLGAGMTAGPIVGCGGDRADGTLRVFAAASLADVAGDLAEGFTAATGVEVDVNTAGSSALRLQLDEGAAADLFIPADPTQLALLDVPIVGDPTPIATNRLVVAHRDDGPRVEFDEFDDDALLLGACAPQVPCGAYAASAWDALGVVPALDTEEPDVRSVAAKVANGDLDAGVVYATDVLADARLLAVDLPSEADDAVSIVYPAAVLAQAADADAARRFVEFARSDAGRSIIVDNGFGTP